MKEKDRYVELWQLQSRDLKSIRQQFEVKYQKLNTKTIKYLISWLLYFEMYMLNRDTLSITEICLTGTISRASKEGVGTNCYPSTYND